MRFLFVDVETNDHPSKRFELRIVTVTWIIAQPNSFVEKMENHIVKPDGFRIAPGATRVHGVTEDQANKYGRSIAAVLGGLVHDLQSFADLTIVGHNVDFDRKVIGAELSRNGFCFDIFALPFICTMQSTKALCGIPRAGGRGYKYPTLQELYLNLFGHCFSDAHTSKADAEATARCFFELIRRGALPDLKPHIPRREPLDSRVRQNARALIGNSAAARTPTQSGQVRARAAETNDYRKEEEGYRRHIKEIILDGVEGGGLAVRVENEPRGQVPATSTSYALKDAVSANPVAPVAVAHAEQTFTPIGISDGFGAAVKSSASTPVDSQHANAVALKAKTAPTISNPEDNATPCERVNDTINSNAGSGPAKIPKDIWIIGILMVIMTIGMFSTGQPVADRVPAAHKAQNPRVNVPLTDGGSQGASPSAAPHSEVTAETALAGMPRLPKEVVPPVGRQHILRQEQISYCLSEEIRIEAMRNRIDLISRGEVAWFNSRVADFKSRCGRYRYYDSVMDAARVDVELHRDGLNAVGEQRVVDWRQEQKLRGKP